MGMILEGVLRMPPSCWSGDVLDVAQRASIYLEAANLIESQQAELAALRINAERYRKLRDNHNLAADLFSQGVCGEELDSLLDAMEASDAKP